MSVRVVSVSFLGLKGRKWREGLAEAEKDEGGEGGNIYR